MPTPRRTTNRTVDRTARRASQGTADQIATAPRPRKQMPTSLRTIAKWRTYGVRAFAVLMAIGCIVGMAVWTRATKRDPADYFDMLAVGIPLFHAFARIGCFLGGCCFGIG